MKTDISPQATELRRRAEAELAALQAGRQSLPMTAELCRRAKARLRMPRRTQRSAPGDQKPETEADTQRLLQELQVHQVELEMQNAELQETRNRMEGLLEKYTDLFDFAPVGYFSLDAQGRILEVNLTGAASLGVERSRLINQPLTGFMVPASQPPFLAFLGRIFTGTGKQVCEAALLKKGASAFWASFYGTSAISLRGPPKWCRVVVSDITALKQAQEAQRRTEAVEAANLQLKREIARRRVVEKALRKSEQHYSELLDQSRHMQQQLRLLSQQLLVAQEEERKKISRELHDVIAQTLTGINIQLANLKQKAASNTRGLEQHIARTQQLIERSVSIVHRFALELRPAVLDDLGLIPALHALMKNFNRETGIRVSLSAVAAIRRISADKRTVLYRVAQEALTNVARHAQATQAEVKIQKINSTVSMEISDNGRGFRQERVLRGKRKHRLGLLGMRERVEMVKGSFTVRSAPGKGTTLLVQVPLADRSGGKLL